MIFSYFCLRLLQLYKSVSYRLYHVKSTRLFIVVIFRLPFPFGEFRSLTISRQTSGERAGSMLYPCFLREAMSWICPCGFITSFSGSLGLSLPSEVSLPFTVARPVRRTKGVSGITLIVFYKIHFVRFISNLILYEFWKGNSVWVKNFNFSFLWLGRFFKIQSVLENLEQRN